MPFILRKIRKAKWYKHANVPWLAEGELQADALSDLGTSANTLSVWLVKDDRSNFEQILAALATRLSHISNIDYFILDLQVLSSLKINTEKTKGDTLDEEANFWHLDLIELTASQLTELAKTIFAEAEIERVKEKQTRRLLVEAVKAERIDPAKLNPSVRAKIDNLSS